MDNTSPVQLIASLFYVRKPPTTIMGNKTKGAGDDYPVIPQEPIFIPAGDRRVLLNGHPPFVPCRVVADARYQEMKKELASLKEVVKELIPIAEENQRHHEVYATVFPKFSPISEAYKSTIERAKKALR